MAFMPSPNEEIKFNLGSSGSGAGIAVISKFSHAKAQFEPPDRISYMLARLKRWLSQRSIQTLLVILVYALCAPLLPASAHRLAYTISLGIKDLLMWVMPFTVCFFIAHTVTSFERRAVLFVGLLLGFECLSNMMSVWCALGFASVVTEALPPLNTAAAHTGLDALWRLPLTRPGWWSADKGVLAGLTLGLLAAFYRQPTLLHVLALGKQSVQWLLTQVFARLIPLFVLGFAANMLQTSLLQSMATQYGVLLLGLVVLLVAYIAVLFWVGSRGSSKSYGSHVRNLMPAGAIALSSGCSLSTMPWTIAGTAKNLDRPQLAEAIIPATTNIQQIGDCMANAFLCFVLYKHFFGVAPSLGMLATFSIAFVAARFATAAVIGGAIFIMLPVYESTLGFTPDMIAVILALNVVLDPIITSSNVVANGALCRIFERVYARVTAILPQKPETLRSIAR
jgi:Na+/H+-dicarboxylate symporter